MFSRRKGLIKAAIALVVAGFIVVPAGGASGATSSIDQSNMPDSSSIVETARAIQARYLNGAQTASDAKWVQDNPDISKWIVDPSKSTTYLISSKKVPQPRGTAAKPLLLTDTCVDNAYGNENRNSVGVRLYSYVSEIRYCFNSTKITTFPLHTAYFSNMSGGVNVISNMIVNQALVSGNNGYITHQGPGLRSWWWGGFGWSLIFRGFCWVKDC